MDKLLYSNGVVRGIVVYNIGTKKIIVGDSDDYDVVGNQKSYRIIRGYRGGQIVTAQEKENILIYVYLYTYICI